jgi:TonB family protein
METRINIKKPCPENWETMKIGLHSRFCDNCEKNVVDFTNKDRREILEYILRNHDKRVCGHIYPHQLDFTQKDLIVTIKALSDKTRNSNLTFYLLTLGTLILSSCDNHNNSEKSIETEIIDTPRVETGIDTLITEQFIDTLRQNEQTKRKDEIEIIIDAIDGEILVGSDTTFGHSEPFPYVEIMPEFKGGIDSLMSFIKQNLIYPKWERENKIEGKVFVTFVVDKNGKIKDPYIIRSVQGSKNFDKEVIRVISIMPEWTPGQQDGKNVDVQFNLPINFKL